MKNFPVLLCLFISFLFSCGKSIGQNSQDEFNGDFERINYVSKYPVGWMHSDGKNYKFALDSSTVQHGKYALSIASTTDTVGFGAFTFAIPKTFEGSEVELRGYLKTEGVNGGFAGFWLRIDGTSAFDNMQGQNIHGTTDWKQYSIKLPYNSQKAINIVGGALLAGKGKIWFDNIELFVDGKPIENAVPKKVIRLKADMDTAFIRGSGINAIVLDPQVIINLKLLGQVWGFLKYHHPEIAKGNYNMDAELFRVMPDVIKARSNNELSKVLEQWTDKLGKVNACDNCKPNTDSKVKPIANYGNIFDHSVLNKSFTDKLQTILDNHKITESYYIGMTGIGNPIFDHESGYYNIKYPDAGCRLLCLFKYWNMVQYFFPYKHLIGKDWNQTLPEFIPQFVNDKNSTEYILTTLKLISSIHDTHANIWSGNAELEAYRGKYRPSFKAGFVENKLVITGFESDSVAVKESFKIGDVITKINGVTVEELIRKYLPITAASNYTTQLRDMPYNYLLRSNNPHFEITIKRRGNILNAAIEGKLVSKIGLMNAGNISVKDPGYYLINENIGYLYPAKYHDANLPAIREMFKNTKGIIIDMRCYPSEFMPFTFGAYIKSGSTPFVKFTNGSINQPGLFVETPKLDIKPDGNSYKGKVIVIVNEQSQSEAEYTTMAFQSSPHVKVIGSTTAGADGNVSRIILPGGISTLFSGIGILYPDGTQTQRKGVKIDIVVKPTIKGIKAGIDEPLEKAKALIME